jgi:hypothetical protein
MERLGTATWPVKLLRWQSSAAGSSRDTIKVRVKLYENEW